MNQFDLKHTLCSAIRHLQREMFIAEERRAMLLEEMDRCEVLADGVDGGSRCIMPAPRIEGANLFFLPIRLKLHPYRNEELRRYTMYHEVAHFLSIDQPTQTGNQEYSRAWGICQTVYRIEQGKVEVWESDTEMRRENEQMNDCLACYLFERMEGRLPAQRFLRKRGRFAMKDQDFVVRQYLAHQRIE